MSPRLPKPEPKEPPPTVPEPPKHRAPLNFIAWDGWTCEICGLVDIDTPHCPVDGGSRP